MAYRPSMRSKNEDLDMELDIRPVMNLMVVLIPLLIASAEWVKLGVIEINVPPPKTVGAGSGAEGDKKDTEKKLKLDLNIAITEKGITIGNAQALLAGEEGEGPTIKREADGNYDYASLKDKLIELKKKIKDKGYVDENRAVLTASSDIKYQVIIDVMDNIQTYEENGRTLALFPEVNFGSIIQ